MRAQSPKIFRTERDLARAAKTLSERCAILRAVHRRTGTPELRAFDADFAGLAKIITGQQVSAQSAAAIWKRVSEGISPFEARHLAGMREAQLARLGLSRPKIRTLKSLAGAVERGELNFDELNLADDARVIERLTSLHGVGPWTADIYLLFALRRADAFPAGDLALQLSAQRLFALDARPGANDLAAIAERWRPWRGAAAHLLWAEYALSRRMAAKNKAKSYGKA